MGKKAPNWKVQKMSLLPKNYEKISGSNTHNNGNPAGDGQAGNDGEGKEGNLTQIFVKNLQHMYLSCY